jgi:hypothetical protein
MHSNRFTPPPPPGVKELLISLPMRIGEPQTKRRKLFAPIRIQTLVSQAISIHTTKVCWERERKSTRSRLRLQVEVGSFVPR